MGQNLTKRLMQSESDANQEISDKSFFGTASNFTKRETDSQAPNAQNPDGSALVDPNSLQIDEPANQKAAEALSIVSTISEPVVEAMSGQELHDLLLQRALDRQTRIKEEKEEQKRHQHNFDYNRSALGSNVYKQNEVEKSIAEKNSANNSQDLNSDQTDSSDNSRRNQTKGRYSPADRNNNDDKSGGRDSEQSIASRDLFGNKDRFKLNSKRTELNHQQFSRARQNGFREPNSRNYNPYR